MKRHLKNKDGYALLIAVAVLMIFAILGLSLMGLTANGIQKNETRENIVQATDLADKGTDFLIKNIQTELEEYITNGNINKALFKEKLLSTIQAPNLDCRNNGLKIPGDNGNTRACIDVKNIKDVYIRKEDGSLIVQELKRQVPIISTGIVNGKEVKTTATVIVGTDAVPDQLKYAISTNNGGNLYLHGGIEIQGDIKTDNNLIISRQATWFSGSTAQWQPSVRTKVIASQGSVTPKVIFSKENKAVYDLKQFSNYNDHISGSYLENMSRYTKYSASTPQGQYGISNLFFNSQPVSVVTNTNLPQDTVEITQKIVEKYKVPSNKENYTSNLNITGTNQPTKNFNKTDAVFVSDTATERVQETYKYFEDVCVRYILFFCIERQQVEKTGIRTVDRNTYKLGNMNINSGSSSTRQQIDLKGTYFVYGDLTISNVNLRADAIIYVQGKVDISESTIRGVNDTSTLILFSNGNIDMYNLSVNSGSNDPSRIKGFFYTKQDMIMYGVGSNINLTGGISARRLILTGVRGDTKNRYLSETEQAQIVNGTAQQYARLKIIYDQDLISTYTEFLRDEEEEYIQSLSSPEIIERN